MRCVAFKLISEGSCVMNFRISKGKYHQYLLMMTKFLNFWTEKHVMKF